MKLCVRSSCARAICNLLIEILQVEVFAIVVVVVVAFCCGGGGGGGW